jgi:hypothetical protein
MKAMMMILAAFCLAVCARASDCGCTNTNDHAVAVNTTPAPVVHHYAPTAVRTDGGHAEQTTPPPLPPVHVVEHPVYYSHNNTSSSGDYYYQQAQQEMVDRSSSN